MAYFVKLGLKFTVGFKRKKNTLWHAERAQTAIIFTLAKVSHY